MQLIFALYSLSSLHKYVVVFVVDVRFFFSLLLLFYLFPHAIKISYCSVLSLTVDLYFVNIFNFWGFSSLYVCMTTVLQELWNFQPAFYNSIYVYNLKLIIWRANFAIFLHTQVYIYPSFINIHIHTYSCK